MGATRSKSRNFAICLYAESPIKQAQSVSGSLASTRANIKCYVSFGVGRTEQKITRLEEHAHHFIRSQSGFVGELFCDEVDARLEDFLSTVNNTEIQVIGPELIFGRLFDKIGYGVLQSELFGRLVISRLFNPGSKLKTIDYLERYQGVSYPKERIYVFLDSLCKPSQSSLTEEETNLKATVERITFEHTKRVLRGKITVAFYDMTTLYFEASDEDDLRKTGFSKDGKHQCPQIFLGLLTAGGGNPIGYEIFEGHTFIPVLQNVEKKYGIGRPVVVADAALLPADNCKHCQNYTI